MPRYRGFSPLVNALINGDSRIGVTALFASDKYDCGEIILQKSLEISYPQKIQEAINKISNLYSEIVIEIINQIKNSKNLDRKKQENKEATYSVWRDEKDYFFSWEESAKKIQRFVDAVGTPYLGAKTFMNNELITIEKVELLEDVYVEKRDFNIGKIIFFEKNYPVVICKKGLLKIIKARYVNKDKSIFPLKKFRIRFTKEKLV